jgi:hypothetical protein
MRIVVKRFATQQGEKSYIIDINDDNRHGAALGRNPESNFTAELAEIAEKNAKFMTM